MELLLSGAGTIMTPIAQRLFGEKPEFGVQWFDAWDGQLDEALRSLPETDACPHELIRQMARNPIAARKIFALVTEQTVPVAVIALRRRGSVWVPATQWMLPGTVFPSRDGYAVRAMAALGIEVESAWWRMGAPPPAHPYIRHLEQTPTLGLPCSADFEQFWRETGKFKDIRKARNHCTGFTLEVDPPVGLEWIIRHWADKWSSSRDNYADHLEDRLLAASYMTSIKKYHTLMLMDQGTPIGGATFNVHRNDLVAGYLYRDPAYDHHRVGTRIIDLAFSWAAGTSYNNIDLGGGFVYKTGWAADNGVRWKFEVSPPLVYHLNRIIRKGKNAGSRLLHQGRQGAAPAEHANQNGHGA